MKLNFVKLGTIAQKPIEAMVENYQKRLAGNYRVSATYIKEARRDPEFAMNKLASYQDSSVLRVALHETGTLLTTKDFAKKFDQWISSGGAKSVAFFVGGPYGFPEGFLESCHFVWSLSKATLPSDYAWLLAWEQTYRAHSVLKGLPYHHE